MKEEQIQLIKKFCYILEIRNYSYNSIKSYKSRLVFFLTYFNKKDISRISEKDIKRYLSYCIKVKNYSLSSLKQQLNFIRLFFATVFNRKVSLCFSNNLHKNHNLPVILSVDEVSKVLDCIGSLKHKMIISIIYACGLMLHETVNMKGSNIDFRNNVVRIQSEENVIREVKLSENLQPMLQRYCRIYKPKKWLFENPDGKQYSSRNIQSIFKQALKKANVQKNASIYSLRHSFAVHLLEKGIDVKHVQKLLGHKNIKSTLIYTYICKNCIKQIESPYDMLND